MSLLLLAIAPWYGWAQPSLAERSRADGWAPFGNTTIAAGVSGAASGPVDRVWFEGANLRVALPGGEIFRATDAGGWQPAPEDTMPPRTPDAPANGRNPRLRQTLAHPLAAHIVYGIGDQVYRSDDAGLTFTGLTRYRGISLVGDTLNDLALNPLDPDDLAIATDLGVWRSRDGGLTWFQAGEGLPNFAVRRILAFPQATRGLQVQFGDGRALEWVPGSVYGWKPLEFEAAAVPPTVLRVLRSFGDRATAWDSSGDSLYLGRADGTLMMSADGGATWREYAQPGLGRIRAIHAHPADERVALAVGEADNGAVILLRTLNAGAFWDLWTPTGLRTAAFDAVAPAWEQDLLFLTAGLSLYRIPVDFRAMSRPVAAAPQRLGGLPARTVDLRLDPSGTVLFAIAENRGVFTLDAPTPALTPMVRNAADLSHGMAAPGTLLSIYGEPLRQLRANGEPAALLGFSASSNQVQLPYSISSDRVELTLESASAAQSSPAGIQRLSLALRRAAPAIFLHPDGNPFVLHPENGLFMDENNPLRPGTHLQVLMTGLGAVSPDWPAGMAAPAENPPVVLAPMEAFVNGLRVPVLRATLAPGYAGIYQVELELPAVLDEGVAALHLVAGGTASNRVPIHIAY